MIGTSDTKSNHRLSAKLAAGLAISAFLVLGTFVASAGAQDRRGGDHRGGHERGGGHRGGHERGYGGNRDWRGGGYYPAPPVVYGTPYDYPPPVVYGPGIGVYLPGINIEIR